MRVRDVFREQLKTYWRLLLDLEVPVIGKAPGIVYTESGGRWGRVNLREQISFNGTVHDTDGRTSETVPYSQDHETSTVQFEFWHDNVFYRVRSQAFSKGFSTQSSIPQKYFVLNHLVSSEAGMTGGATTSQRP